MLLCENILKQLLTAGCDANTKTNTHPRSLVHYAVSCKNVNILRLLINSGANVNATDSKGYIPLHHAIVTNSLKKVEFLIKAGSNVTAEAHNGCTPLFAAAYCWKLDILRLLVDAAGVNINENCHKIGSPLINLIESSLFDKKRIRTAVKLLIEFTDINLTYEDRNNMMTTIFVLESLSAKRKYFYDIILRHIAKLKILNFSIDVSLLNAISKYSDYNEYFSKCTQELEHAKATKLHNCWVTFFNLLVDDESKLVKYAGNDDLIEDFEKSVGKFPIYGPAMQSNLLKGINERKLFDRASNVLSYFFPFFSPTHLIIKETLEVMSEKDWKKLCE